MEANMESIKSAQEKFAELIQSEFERIERMKADKKVTDFSKFYIEKQGRDAVAVHALHER